VADSVLRRYEGRWDIVAVGNVRFVVRNGRLVLESDGGSGPLVADSDTTFQVANSRIRFVREGGRFDRVVVTGPGGVTEGRRIVVVLPGDADLAAYTGTYYSPELEAVYRVVRRGDTLLLRHVRHGDVALLPVDARTFSGPRWPFGRVVFQRDDGGAVTAFLLTGSRVRDLRFERLPEGSLPR
jgi:hypothetical protein